MSPPTSPNNKKMIFMNFADVTAEEFASWRQDYSKTRPYTHNPEAVVNFNNKITDTRMPYVVEGLGSGGVVFIEKTDAASGASSELKRGSDVKRSYEDSGMKDETNGNSTRKHHRVAPGKSSETVAQSPSSLPWMDIANVTAEEFGSWRQDYLKTRVLPPNTEPVVNFNNKLPDTRMPYVVSEGLGMGRVVFIKKTAGSAAAGASGASSELKGGSISGADSGLEAGTQLGSIPKHLRVADSSPASCNN